MSETKSEEHVQEPAEAPPDDATIDLQEELRSSHVHEVLDELDRELVGLKPTQLDQLPLGDRLRDAIDEARGMRAHGALRRQRQLIGKLLGHSRTATTEKYSHLAADPIRQANERIGKRLEAAMSPKTKAGNGKRKGKTKGKAGGEVVKLKRRA